MGQQESVLARCHTFAVAVCVATTFASLLNVFPTLSSISFAGNKEGVPPSVASQLVDDFKGLLTEAIPLSSDSRGLHEVTVPLGSSDEELMEYMQYLLGSN